MPQELYNAGRVVGLSAYEIYVKKHDAVDPDSDPADEREWLASMLGMGSSMLLKVPASVNKGKSENWIYEADLPNNTLLCAASTIIASFFQGEGRYTKSALWADGVASYGNLISNTSSKSPSGNLGPNGPVPNNVATWSAADKKKLTQYMKIVDGIVIQPGNWTNSSKTPPQKDFTPNLKHPPRIRLHIQGNIDTPFEILLTGFMIDTVVIGETGVDGGSTNTTKPQNGDFLGPASYPWSNKIVFSVPSSYIHYFVESGYQRQINGPDGKVNSSLSVDDTPIIDMETTKPRTYYETNITYAGKTVDPSYYMFNSPGVESLYPYTVNDFSARGNGDAVLTVYQKSSLFPPALYGSFVDATGANKLAPLDCVAPGHVKMFKIEDDSAAKKALIDYITVFPASNPMNRKNDGTIQQLVINQFGEWTLGSVVSGDLIPIKDTSGNNISNAKAFVSKFGGHVTGLTLSMAPDKPVNEGQLPDQYWISHDGNNMKTGSDGTKYNAGNQTKMTSTLDSMTNLNWAMLLTALSENTSIDLLGDLLKQFRAGLSKNYICFPNGLRLYISKTKPTDTDVPEGSIGIGWGIKTD